MTRPRIFTILCAGILLWTTCTTDTDKNSLLSEAINTVDNNPKEALELLESISPELLDYDKDQHMEFVTTLTQARYMDYQDITVDSLILDAQRYFATSRNYEMAARASFYAAMYWYEGEAIDKAVEYWQAAFSFAEKAGNNLFTAKSAYWLGRTYFIQEQWENSMTYCQKALMLYSDLPDAEHYKLYITEMLGQVHRRVQNQEQAYQYFDDGLKAAKNQTNTKYESRFLRNIGLIHRDKGEYQQAKEYFDLVLSKQPEPEDRMRFYLSYAILYRAMNLPDSALHYLNTIENQVQEITYPNTRRDIYKELVTYHKANKGDGDKIARYSQLAHNEDLRIKKSQSEKKINAINQQLEQLKQKKQTEGKKYRRIFDYGLIAICLLISLLIIIEVYKRGLKEKYIEIKDSYKIILDSYRKEKKKYSNSRNIQFYQAVDLLRLSIDGLDIISNISEDLYQKKLAHTGSPVWEQQLILREKFCTQLAGNAKTKLEKLHNGDIALSKLTPEDLPFLQLVRMKYPDEKVSRWLGYKDSTPEAVKLHKEQIRRILIEAGMTDENIEDLLPKRAVG
ncbi:MAG: tetratricopeptide repeat protein [Tannerella sp.]|jgi:tetratricopeptide (TPR) repeat protein|nr:tetratricopeptide repeat protein [Tannerella sp.]